MANAAFQHALSFENDEIYTYHDTGRAGFFSLLTKPAKGRIKQLSHRLSYLPEVLSTVNRDQDTWISQNEFFRPNRQVVNLWRLTVAFVDLDTYKVPSMAMLSVEGQVNRLLQLCHHLSVPEPTLVVYSGRGLQVKWVFSKPLPGKALPRWKALQDELCRLFLPIGADLNARDASRVLRVVETVNTKSQCRAQVVFWTKANASGTTSLSNGAIAYDFDALTASVLPILREDLIERDKNRAEQRELWSREKAERERRIAQLTVISGGKDPALQDSGNLRKFVRSQLAWDRIGDIRKIAELRGLKDGFPAEQRDLPLFLCACFLADGQLAKDIESELVELASEFAPTWSRAQLKSCASAAITRAQASERGEKVEFGGRAVDPRYRWRNETLIERLQITPDEERQMTTIISKEEKRQRSLDRSAKARKLAGSKPRSDWLESVEQRRASARLLRARGLSYPQIATELNISVGTAHSYCKG